MFSFKNEKRMVKENKIIVVGAGISGLAAAKDLQAKGYNVTVLEATDKIGGRIDTDNSLGIPFEKGASWIHTPIGNPLTDLIKQTQSNIKVTDFDDTVAYYNDGTKIKSSDYWNAKKMFYKQHEQIEMYGEKNESYADVISKYFESMKDDDLQKFFIANYVTFDTGETDKFSSTLYNYGEEYEGIDAVITNGYEKIPQYLAKNLTIQFNTKVHAIDYSSDKILLNTSNGNYKADKVIVTVPLGVLKKNIIQFMPDLPVEKKQAIKNTGMNHVNKFLVTFNACFWHDSEFIILAKENPNKYSWFLNVNKTHQNSNALLTFAYGMDALESEKRTDSQIKDEIYNNLKKIYKHQALYPTNLLRSKWSKDPNTYGAYSYTSTSTSMKNFDILARDINSKIYFAGEHTSRDYFSTAHGAYLSGKREARKVIKSLRTSDFKL